MGIVRKLRIEHNFAVDPDRVIQVTGIGRASILSAQLIWKKLTGTLDGVIKLQGSNNNPAAEDFEDLGFQQTLNVASNSQGIQDGEFAFEHGYIDIKKGGLTGGTLILEILAKTR